MLNFDLFNCFIALLFYFEFSWFILLLRLQRDLEVIKRIKLLQFQTGWNKLSVGVSFRSNTLQKIFKELKE